MIRIFRGDDRRRIMEVGNPRLPCSAVLDGSAAMAPWAPALQDAVRSFRQSLLEYGEVAGCADVSLLYAGGGRIVQTPFAMPMDLDFPDLHCEGTSDVRGALQKGFSLLQERRQAYRMAAMEYFRPMLFLLTATTPPDILPVGREKDRLYALLKERKLVFCPIAIGDEADPAVLAGLHPDGVAFRLTAGGMEDAMQWVARCIAHAACAAPGQYPLPDTEARIQMIRA